MKTIEINQNCCQSDLKGLTNVINTCADLFSSNPLSNHLELKNDYKTWNNLMKALVSATKREQTGEKAQKNYNSKNAPTGLRQIVTWPGGKKNELKHIYPNLPSYDRYFEPFVGGGSVFMGINAREHYINDFSTDLISLYRNIQSGNKSFFQYVEEIDASMKESTLFFQEHKEELLNLYQSFLKDRITKHELETSLKGFCEANKPVILDILGGFASLTCILVEQIAIVLTRKMVKMKERGQNEPEGVFNNLETGIRSALYNNYRALYNRNEIKKNNPMLSAIFLYIRQNVMAAKFSFNKKGEFNESYGGGSQNRNSLAGKLSYYKSDELKEHFKNAHIYNLDFEDFLRETCPTENDFIFLDPPYDTPFSTYDGNDFNRRDHERLASYLMNECKAKWMMIISKTDFIYNLYNRPGLYITSYDKKYTCNVVNNNDLNAIHLLITNYPAPQTMISENRIGKAA